jgi:hypothetical protein
MRDPTPEEVRTAVEELVAWVEVKRQEWLALAPVEPHTRHVRILLAAHARDQALLRKAERALRLRACEFLADKIAAALESTHA